MTAVAGEGGGQRHRFWRLALIPVAGLAIGAGLEPWSLWYLALIGWALAIWLASAARHAGLVLWAAITVGYLVIFHWITEPFLIDAAATGWLAPVALITMTGGLALFPAAGGALGAWLAGPSPWRPLGMAAGLGLGEMVRAYIFTGFPWALPGHLYLETAALPASALAGAHGLSFVVLLGAGFVAMAPLVLRITGVAIWGLPFLTAFALPPAPETETNAPVMRLIQPNAPQHQKWDPDFIAIFWQRALELTAAEGEIDALAWPETTLPMLLGRSDDLRPMIARASGGVPAAIGAQRYGPQDSPRNTMALLTGQAGEITLTYDKHHLVPFGEYLPLPAVAEALGIGPLAAQLAGRYRPGDAPITFEMPGIGRVMPMICYEAIFPQYLGQVERPDLLLHLTNDAWFGNFAGPYQHLSLAKLRAAESGLPLMRAANTGVTAVIDARGRVLNSLPLNEAGYLDAVLPAALPATPYARLGDWPALGLLLVLLAFVTALRRRHAPH